MNNNSSGVGILGLLGVVFVTLKLCDVINWSWWYVTLPFWGGFVLLGSIVIVCGIIYLITSYITSKRDRK